MARPFGRTAVDGSSTSLALLVTDEVVVWVWSALGTVGLHTVGRRMCGLAHRLFFFSLPS